ncbi:MAG: zinc-binding alcohol dehydrogenase [Phototrophicales bacterium]|nr:MAG: zinc-binding alcohol dehydrogenase [Phototrophicales bacterium]
MKAVVIYRYGKPDVLQIVDLPLPRIKPDEALIKVRFAAANPKDTFIRKGRFKLLTGWRFPLQLGSDLCGDVIEVGHQVNHIRVGDVVWGAVNGWRGGAHAEYIAIKGAWVAHKPTGISDAEAAALPLVSLTALQALKQFKAGQRIFINGASGGVGTAAVQIAKVLGLHVTATCSERTVELVKSLGADELVDYTQQDIKRLDAQFDVFFDVFGNFHFSSVQGLLTHDGRYITTVPNPRNFWDALRTRFTYQTAQVIVVQSNIADLERLRNWVETGQLKPVIDSVYPLSDIRAVHEKLETKRTQGKIVLEIAQI